MKRIIVKKNTYQDSFNLMLLAENIRNLPGIREVAIFMGTSANKSRLLTANFSSDALTQAGSEDLCIGLEFDDLESGELAISEVDSILRGKPLTSQIGGSKLGILPRSIEGALRVLPGANLVSISLPGEYAGNEARKALERGLNVFLFSNNIPIDEELRLKQLAQSKGLLLMGPDCGTAMIAGNSLGFCNNVASGKVGMVAASGTGAQEVMCLLDKNGIGVSHVIGTGGTLLETGYF